MERAKLAKEKQLREEAVKQKEDAERQLRELQEEVRIANEALVSIPVFNSVSY